ncbi:unnamed protein product, partial [Laminaria digitata]
VVGGLAEVKQERQLSRRPEVVVATPGRFWEMAGTHAHLSRLETLRHLVVDEADRMLERGHYPELQRLFAMLDKEENEPSPFLDASAATTTTTTTGAGASADALDPMDEEDGINDAELSAGLDGDVDPDAGKDSDAEVDVGEDGSEVGGATSTSSAAVSAATASAVSGPPRDHFARQTYVFSATLTLGSSGRQQRKRKSASAVAAAAAIMNRVGVRGDPAIIDMGRRTVGGDGGEVEEAVAAEGLGAGGAGEGGGAEVPALPSTLRLCSIKSLQMEKDVHAYLFCASYPGRTLIFVNAIACARRLAVLLCSLKIPASPLHAQMQQRQRLKSL